MARRWKNNLTPSDVTPEVAFLNRRQIMAGIAAGVGLAGVPDVASAAQELMPNSWEEITSYNNFYEFGTGKEDPVANAHLLTTAPWKVTIDGLVDRPGDYDFSEIMQQMTVEQRIYRFRCVDL